MEKYLDSFLFPEMKKNSRISIEECKQMRNAAFVSVAVSVVALLTLAILTSPSILSGFGCFGLSLVLWLFALARTPLSSAYPFVALGILVRVFARRNGIRRAHFPRQKQLAPF